LGVLKNKKGIYIFFVEPNFPFTPNVYYPIYIGRVMKKNTFFKRFDEYVKAIGELNIKRNRQLMANAWPNNTFIYFYVLANDIEIEETEKQLIDYVIPPLNNQFYIDEAKNTRSIYN